MSKKYDFNEYVDRHNSDCKKFNPGRYAADVLPMWIADTDFRVPREVYEVAKKRVEHDVYGYPYDLPEFNTSVQGWMKRRHQWDIKPEHVEFAFGVVPAAIYVILALTQAGDSVTVMTPLYSPLREAVVDNGRTLLSSSMNYVDGHYEVDWEDLEKKLAQDRTRLLILCNPHNPSGKVFTREELEKISKLCLKYKVYIFADEIHADIVYSGSKHIPIASLSEDVANITITGLNPGKSFNVAGVRTAAVIIQNKDLMNKYIIARKNNKAMGRTVMGQNVFIACYEHGDQYIDEEVEYLEANQEYLVKYINENIPELKAHKQHSTYLSWVDCRELNLPQKELMDLFEHHGKIAMNSGDSFGVEGTGFVRLNFAVPRSVLEDGCQRLKNAVDYWKQNK